MKIKILSLFLLTLTLAACGGGVAEPIRWAVAEDGSWAKCDGDRFPVPSDPGFKVVCHWECGQLHGQWVSADVIFPHEGGKYLPVDQTVLITGECFQ